MYVRMKVSDVVKVILEDFPGFKKIPRTELRNTGCVFWKSSQSSQLLKGGKLGMVLLLRSKS